MGLNVGKGKGLLKTKKHTSPLAWGGPDRNAGNLNGARTIYVCYGNRLGSYYQSTATYY